MGTWHACLGCGTYAQDEAAADVAVAAACVECRGHGWLPRECPVGLPPPVECRACAGTGLVRCRCGRRVEPDGTCEGCSWCACGRLLDAEADACTACQAEDAVAAAEWAGIGGGR